ncbi:hypothetical protein GF406_15320 [candidate division KSB1 bacterium]|nr:hypothetical protein [candidate division KSB1 bacterium]
MKPLAIIAVCLALIALGLSIFILTFIEDIKKIALSEISVEEHNSLITPVFDQASEQMNFVAIYELGVSNLSGPDIVLETIEKADDLDFIVGLKGPDVVNIDLKGKAFLVEPALGEIQSNPRLLTNLHQNPIAEKADVNTALQAGKSKKLRVGFYLSPYQDQESLVNMALVSFKLTFSNGKTSYFRRGFPIQPLQPIPNP